MSVRDQRVGTSYSDSGLRDVISTSPCRIEFVPILMQIGRPVFGSSRSISFPHKESEVDT